jgi:hypothetical protein
VTPQARAHLAAADRVFYLLSDTATSAWLRALNPRAESLHDCYRAGEPGGDACERMVDRILGAVRAGNRTCAAFYGHPAVGVPAGLQSVRRARSEGFPATMLPAISFEDCLFADLGVDPASSGRLLYEATDFLVRPRTVDPTAALVLLQVGAVGLVDFTLGDQPNPAGLRLLAEALARHYPRDHPVALYRISQLPMFDPRIDWMPLAQLADAAALSVESTLFVSPLPRRPIDARILERLRAPTPQAPGADQGSP